MYPKIHSFIASLTAAAIPSERKQTLQPLINYIQSKVALQKEVQLHLICTHNSRRSHFSQVWCQVAATYYGISKVFCYSGGTQATAMFPAVVQTLEQVGFQIHTLAEGPNPIYALKYSESAPPILCFSKTYNDAFNPKYDFAAILTCSEADAGCPFIDGAEKRIAIPFEDPKAFDNTPEQAEQYSQRNYQIAAEMSYVFSQIQPQNLAAPIASKNRP